MKEDDIISLIITKCNTLDNNQFPKAIMILYGNAIKQNTISLEDKIQQQITALFGIKNIGVKCQQLPVQIICEWCSMKSTVHNSQYVCHYCGKETDVLLNDRRLIIKFLFDKED